MSVKEVKAAETDLLSVFDIPDKISAAAVSTVKPNLAKFGLTVDTAAADILSGISNTDSKSVSAALTSLTDNLTQLDDDYVSTPDQNTIVYSMAWTDLEKVTSYDGKTYSSNNNVFSSTGTQQSRSKVYVNFKKKEIWADIDVKLTRAEGTTSTLQTNYETGTAGFTSVPIVATTVRKFKADGTNGHDNFDGINDTMKKNATTIQDVCDGCTGLYSHHIHLELSWHFFSWCHLFHQNYHDHLFHQP